MPDTATLQITMPEMGESVTEGIVLEWHVAVGDFVNEGDTVVEVSTDKVDAEVPAPVSGTITALVAEVDDEVPVGTPLAEMAPGDAGRRVERSGRGSCRRRDHPPPRRLRGRTPHPRHPRTSNGAANGSNGGRCQSHADRAPGS